jgi:hypothetical protein
MKQVFIFCLVALRLAVAAAADGRPTSEKSDTYVRIEVKGPLSVASGYRFDTEIDNRPGMISGVIVSGGVPHLFFELLAKDRTRFDLIKAGNGKSVVVSGDLEVVAITQGLEPTASPPREKPPRLRYIIRVRDIRLAEQK